MLRVESASWADLADVHVGQEAIQTSFGSPLKLLTLGLFKPAPNGRIPFRKLLDINPLTEADGLRTGNPLNDSLKFEARAWCEHAREF